MLSSLQQNQVTALIFKVITHLHMWISYITKYYSQTPFLQFSSSEFAKNISRSPHHWWHPWPRTKWQGRIERRVCGFMTGNKKNTRVHFPHPHLSFQTENKMIKCQSLRTNYVHNSATYSCNCRAYLRPVDIIKAILARPTTLSCTMVPWEAGRSLNCFVLPLSLFIFEYLPAGSETAFYAMKSYNGNIFKRMAFLNYTELSFIDQQVFTQSHWK